MLSKAAPSTIFDNLVRLELGLNPSLTEYWQTLYSLVQWKCINTHTHTHRHRHTDTHTHTHTSIHIYIYIYIYIEREREIYIYIYVYIYTLTKFSYSSFGVTFPVFYSSASDVFLIFNTYLSLISLLLRKAQS